MNPAAHDSPLGKQVAGSAVHDPDLLFPIARAAGREAMGLADPLPFHGVDIWNAWELSWLDRRGKPQVAIGEFRIPASSPNLIESKSFKLYLNSLNQTRFADADALRAVLLADLSTAAGTPIEVVLLAVDPLQSASIQRLDGECIDDLDIDIDQYGPPQAGFLRVHDAAEPVTEVLVSHLLKSNCPVTGQPDWASVQIRYRGNRIDRAGLLRYLVSYRNHDDFHEQCVERIFRDLLARCAPQELTVHARYTRRGGLDINPWRSNMTTATADNPRLQRQ